MRHGAPQFTPTDQETKMLTIGDKFPSYNVTAVVSRDAGKEFAQITDKTY